MELGMITACALTPLSAGFRAEPGAAVYLAPTPGAGDAHPLGRKVTLSLHVPETTARVSITGCNSQACTANQSSRLSFATRKALVFCVMI